MTKAQIQIACNSAGSQGAAFLAGSGSPWHFSNCRALQKAWRTRSRPAVTPPLAVASVHEVAMWDVTLILRDGGAYTYQQVEARDAYEAVAIAKRWFERDEPSQTAIRAKAVQR